MNFKNELEEMRKNFSEKPMRFCSLPKLDWLKKTDDLYSIYKDKKILLTQGQIYYAQLIQANSLLFKSIPQFDCPASFIYSTDSIMEENPLIMQDIASSIYYYKDKPIEEIPVESLSETFIEIVRVIRDEYDRSKIPFSISYDDGSNIDMIFQSLIVFRKHLPFPKRTLKGSVIPIIACPDKCFSIMILPKKYWSKNFMRAWNDNIL